MTDGRGGWLNAQSIEDCGDVSWEHSLSWAILNNAIENSVLTSSPGRHKMKKSVDAFKLFSESRRWLLADGYNQGGITRDMCLTMLGMDKMALFEVLRHLWLDLDEDIRGTINSALKSAVAAIERQKRATARKRWGGGGKRPLEVAVQNKRIISDAVRVRQESLLAVVRDGQHEDVLIKKEV